MKIAFVQSMRNMSYKNGKLQVDIFQTPGRYALKYGALGYGMLHTATMAAKKFDVSVYSLSSAQISGQFNDTVDAILGCDVVAIQLNWLYESKGAIEFGRYVKDKTGVPIIYGGTHASLFAKELSQMPHIDYVIRGEAEVALIELVKNLEKGELQPNISGIVSHERDNGVTEFIEDIDDILPYDLGLVKTPIPYSVPYAVNRVRGRCSIQCDYCLGGEIDKNTNRRRMVAHSPKWVTRQIAMLKEYQPPGIAFQDNAWAFSLKYMKDVADQIARENTITAGLLPCAVLDGLALWTHWHRLLVVLHLAR